MNNSEFSTEVNIFIVDPENDFSEIPVTVRRLGYDGMIIYLSHSKSADNYRQAFDVGAYNYVEKCVESSTNLRFQSVFEVALQNVKQIERKYMAVSYGSECKLIEIRDIQYFESATNHMINVVYEGGSFKFLSTMQELEERFRDNGFVRVHRSYLVSLDAIGGVRSDEVILNNGESLLVSRDRYQTLKSLILCSQV